MVVSAGLLFAIEIREYRQFKHHPPTDLQEDRK